MQIWDRLRGGLDSTDHRSATCPRGIHADGRCLCQSSLSAVESGARAGISRIVMLAEALFEVIPVCCMSVILLQACKNIMHQET